uniref:Ribophorin I, related n=1 Tax=Neospora caninum (strain Liverpool) TaxID=572307 RepID=A0A0F7U9B5_NEOCL|nr:TPA: Ribophorin I, related [Neospora caninum Liverpool]
MEYEAYLFANIAGVVALLLIFFFHCVSEDRSAARRDHEDSIDTNPSPPFLAPPLSLPFCLRHFVSAFVYSFARGVSLVTPNVCAGLACGRRSSLRLAVALFSLRARFLLRFLALNSVSSGVSADPTLLSAAFFFFFFLVFRFFPRTPLHFQPLAGFGRLSLRFSARTASLRFDKFDEDLLLLEEEQNPNWTPAEKAFRLAQKKREKERVNERLKLTHRQRMEKLNAHLASLSEHFDQPRVGPG